MNERIKVDGKTGRLAGKIAIARDGAKINVNTEIKFSKRYAAVCACSLFALC